MDPGRSVGAVILAAGTSRRYGSPKQLVVVDGLTLLEHALEVADRAGLRPVAAVVPIWLSRPATFNADALRWVRNPFPERGISVSLRLGLEALGDEVGAAIILLGDQPRVASATIEALLAARGERPVVAAESGGILAPPVLLERSHFTLAQRPSGDIGLREILRTNPDLVRGVPVVSHPIDVDTPDDLASLLRP